MWWRCPAGHGWEATIASRTSGRGCPYCAHRSAAKTDSLAARRPELLGEWHTRRNPELDPWALGPGSNKKAWWRCPAGHEWETTVGARARSEQGCPECAGRRGATVASHAELASQWHPTRNAPLAPETVRAWSNKKVWWRCRAGHEWQATTGFRSRGTGCPYFSGRLVLPARAVAALRSQWLDEWHPTRNTGLDPHHIGAAATVLVWWQCAAGHEWQDSPNRRCRSGGCPYCASRRTLPERSLAGRRPDLASEIAPGLNTDIDPWSIAVSSNRQLWWRCGAGYTWKARVSARSVGGTGCPTCSDCRPKGTPVFEARPEIADEWDLDLNDGPGDGLTSGSKVKAWWRCQVSATHCWRAAIQARTRGTGCPYCAHKRPSPETALAVHPEVARQWHPGLNGDISPSDVLPRSAKRAWCRCERRHVWAAPIAARFTGTGCPYCSKREVTPERTLAAVRPDLIGTWHPTRNGDTDPAGFAAHSNRRVWWRCEARHEWQAKVANRTRGPGCPICAARHDGEPQPSSAGLIDTRSRGAKAASR